MSPHPAEDALFSTLYLQLEHAKTPSLVLSVSDTATEAEIRDAYRILALRIHPDKAPQESVRDLHTFYFQKVQSAYRALLEPLVTEPATIAHKQLPETIESLHARNVAFQEALKLDRDRAADAKRAADVKKAAKDAKLRLVKIARVQAREAQVLKRMKKYRKVYTSKLSDRDVHRLRTPIVPAEKVAVASETREDGSDSGLSDWEQDDASDSIPSDWEEEAEKPEPKEAIATRVYGHSKFKHSTASSRFATLQWDAAANLPTASKVEIEGRWDAKLLAGGTFGSVSLVEKKQRENNAASTALQDFKALSDEVDNSYHHTLEAHLLKDAKDFVIMQCEAGVDAAVDKVPGMIDQDVIEQHMLEGGELDRRTSVRSLAITWK